MSRLAAPPELTMQGGVPPSPCTGLCKVEAASGCCAGCYRTLDEISLWPEADGTLKQAIWRRCLLRQAALAQP